MLMGHPSVQEARSFKSFLNIFDKASGLAINQAKSQVFFLNTVLATQRNILQILGFSKGSFPSKYLGVPLIPRSLNSMSWMELIDRIKQKLSSWTLRPLNLPSRLVLIKSVLQVMPIYLFSVLSAPKSVLHEIRCIQRIFLWEGREDKEKFSLVS